MTGDELVRRTIGGVRLVREGGSGTLARVGRGSFVQGLPTPFEVGEQPFAPARLSSVRSFEAIGSRILALRRDRPD